MISAFFHSLFWLERTSNWSLTLAVGNERNDQLPRRRQLRPHKNSSRFSMWSTLSMIRKVWKSRRLRRAIILATRLVLQAFQNRMFKKTDVVFVSRVPKHFYKFQCSLWNCTRTIVSNCLKYISETMNINKTVAEKLDRSKNKSNEVLLCYEFQSRLGMFALVDSRKLVDCFARLLDLFSMGSRADRNFVGRFFRLLLRASILTIYSWV